MCAFCHMCDEDLLKEPDILQKYVTKNLSDMVSNKINMKQTSEDLKSFLTKEMENNFKKITGKIIEKLNIKFDGLSTRIETIGREGTGSRITSQTKSE